MDKKSKKIKKESVEEIDMSDSKMIVRFQNGEGQQLGSEEIELNVQTNVDNLNEIVDVLLKGQNKISDDKSNDKYTFYYGNIEIKKSLHNLLKKVKNLTSEQVLDITYHKQQQFYIRPITRWSSSMQGHKESILSIQFSSNSKYLASGSGDCTIRIWDLQTETSKLILQQHKNWVLIVSFSQFNDIIATSGMDSQVIIWNLIDGSIINILKGHTKWVTSLVWTPIHIDNHRLASAGKDLTIRIWQPKNNASIRILSGHRSCITKLLWSGDNQIYSASEDKTIKVWNPDTGEMLFDLLGHSHWVNSISLNSDYIIKQGGYFIQKDRISDLSREQQIIRAQDNYNKFNKDNNNNSRLVSCSDDHTLILWLNCKLLKRMTSHQQPINMVSYSPDGRYIVSASFDKSLKIWDGYNGNLITNCRGHVSSVYQIAWSPDARMFISASKDTTIKLWDINTKKILHDLPGHSDEVFAIDWSNDGTKVASGGRDKLIKVWKN